MLSRTLRMAARSAGFASFTFAAGTAVYAGLKLAPEDRRPAVRDRVTDAWSRSLLRLFGVELVVGGEAPGPRGVARGRGRVVVANHRSIIDIAVLLSRFGGAVLSRADMARWPIMGSAARNAGTIFVERGEKASGARAIDAMVERLRLNDTICLFPEGTTFVDDEVRPFKPGGFVAAVRANTPIIPVGIAYPLDSKAAYGGETFVQHLANLAGSSHTRAYAEIGAPLEAQPGEDVDALRERARAEVSRLVALARSKQLRDAQERSPNVA